MIFIQNKYTKTYYRIIDRAKSRPKPSCYTEKHHIIPKCVGGTETIVLTFKEHWVCHHLLLKMVSGKLKAKMYYAFKRMGYKRPNQQRIINSKMFERIKIANRILNIGKNNPNYGKNRYKLGPQSEEHKNKLRQYIKTKEHKENLSKSLQELFKDKTKHPMYGTHRLETTKQKLRDHRKGIPTYSNYWIIIFPNKTTKVIKNLNEFCRQNNLQRQNIKTKSGSKKFYAEKYNGNTT